MHATKQTEVVEQPVEKKLASPVKQNEINSDSVQCKFSAENVVQREKGSTSESASPGSNQTGMPDRLKSGLENISGYDMSSVRVHYNSPKPKQLGALAYAQGTNIHLGAGQEKHLPHEGWHVVQQMQGRVTATGAVGGLPLNDSAALEAEAHHMGPRAIRVPTVRRLPLQLVSSRADAPIQRVYAGLTAMGKARVDQQIDDVYERKALEFELGMSRRINNDPAVNTVVDTVVTSVDSIVRAWATHTSRVLSDTYVREFSWPGGDKFYGAFDMTANNICSVLQNPAGKPLRKKLKLIYNVVRNNNLAKWLKIAANELDRTARAEIARDWQIKTESREVERRTGHRPRLRTRRINETVTTGFAHDSKLDALLSGAQVTNIAASMGLERRTTGGGLFSTRRDLFDHTTRSDIVGWTPEMHKAHRERRPDGNAGLTLAEQRTLTVADLPDLTEPETDLVLKRRNLAPTGINRAAYTGNGANSVPWGQGGEFYDVDLGSDSAREAATIKARMEAGISGSTDLMIHAMHFLGVPPASNVMKTIRFALAGWMIAARDHSFYEVFKAAEPYGMAFTIDPVNPGAEYEDAGNLTPMNRAEFAGILPNDGPLANVFPAMYHSVAYKDHLSNLLVGPANTKAQIQTGLRAEGLSGVSLTTMDERDTAALQRLAAVTQAQVINVGHRADLKNYAVRQIRMSPAFVHVGNVFGHERADYLLNGLLRHHHGGATVAKDDLVTQLSDLGVPRSIVEHVSVAEVGRIEVLRQAIMAAVPGMAGALPMAPINLAKNQLAEVNDQEKDFILWGLVREIHGNASIAGAGELLSADTMDRRTQIEQIADMEKTTGVWYTWGPVGNHQAMIGAGSLRQATRLVPSTQGPGMYIGREVTTSAGYGATNGYRCLVVKMSGVPTINRANADQMAKLATLQPRGHSLDPLAAAYLYSGTVSVEILMIYGAGNFARLTTNKGVTLTMDLRHAPVNDLADRYSHPGLWPGHSRANLLAQANGSGINTVGW